MEVWKSFIMGFQGLISGFSSIGVWFITPLVNINGVEITPFFILAPSSLIVILTICIVHFVTGQ